MKLVNSAVLAFASCILAKNVINLDDLLSATNREKREAKNVVSLQDLKEAVGEPVYGDGDKKKAQKRDSQDVFQPTAPSLQSLLPQVKSVSVISGYLRNDETVVSQLENADSFVLVVAPTDEAFSGLSAKTGKKPWEYPEEIQNNETDDQVIKNNLHFLVKAHVSAPIDRQLAEQKSVTLLSGKDLVIEHLSGSDNYQMVVDGEAVPVLSIHQAENGVVFVVDTVLR